MPLHHFPALPLLVAGLLAFPAWAQTNEDEIEVEEVSRSAFARLFNEPASSAGGSFGAPLAFGANWGDVGAGAYAQTFRETPNGADGSMGFTIGFGDADEAVGLETSLALSSLLGDVNAGGGFGEAGSFGLKLHTKVSDTAAFAVGVSGIGRWGGKDNDAQKSAVFIAGTQMLQVPFWDGGSRNLMVNVGIGNQSYNKFGESDVGAFGSLALFFTPQLSAIVDYSGTVLKSAVSWAPFLAWPITVDLGVVNLNGAYDGDPEVAASVGYGFQF